MLDRGIHLTDIQAVLGIYSAVFYTRAMDPAIKSRGDGIVLSCLCCYAFFTGLATSLFSDFDYSEHHLELLFYRDL